MTFTQTFKVERWTLESTETIELTQEQAKQFVLDVEPGKFIVDIPCGGHDHILLLNSPLEAAIGGSVILTMAEVLHLPAGQRLQALESLSHLDFTPEPEA